MEIIDFCNLISERVLVLDGAMGTMIQKAGFTDKDFRGERFATHKARLAGCNDLLCITAPERIKEIHSAYLNAGADIISTNTFNANPISLADYELHNIPGIVREINFAGAALARKTAEDAPLRAWGGRAIVAGSVGPTNKSATMSPDISDPTCRNITYDQLFDAYLDQIIGLIEGGVDILLFETVFDTLNLKSGLDASQAAMRKCNRCIPVMISATISNKSGRILSGQTLKAFCTSVENYPCVVSIGLNCSFGPKDIAAPLRELTLSTEHFISAHPNAGLPDALGQYDISPEKFAAEIRPLLNERLVNIIGGCCGTTPAHIAALRREADTSLPHISNNKETHPLCISGLERIEVRPENNFLIVGERCNVAGSRKFLRLIKEHKYDEALSIAVKQVEDGARVIDINMDDPMLDAEIEMQHFLRLYSSDPEVAKAPVMVDSSNWKVVETALKNLQGKSIVNSISLKEGEETFIRKAVRIHELGAAVIVMAFDEKGQADTYERKIEICRRAYDLLTIKCGFKGEDIIFDVNVMAVATGLEEHSRYGIDFIKAVEWIKKNLPGARTSGGISNLSFAFRGRNSLREAMHTVFLYHAIAAGLDMAIMNPSASLNYDDINPELRALIEDVILAASSKAADMLAEYAKNDIGTENASSAVCNDTNPSLTPQQRIENAIVTGRPNNMFEDIDTLIASGVRGVEIVEGPLMQGMKKVGALFGEGKMFLPQVVKTARVMKLAVDHLAPTMLADVSAGSSAKAGKIVLATVKGDVHDIGKNIVSIVLACNNYEVIDLGVMVEADTIVETALREKPDIICLSGLITPSLSEMSTVAECLRNAGCDIPLMVGGATTSALHTALKIAPVYGGPVIHMKDASQNPIVASQILNPATKGIYIAKLKDLQHRLRQKHEASKVGIFSLEEAKRRAKMRNNHSDTSILPEYGLSNLIVRSFTIEELIPLINWNMLLHAWGIHSVNCQCGCENDAEALRLISNARRLLANIADSGRYDGFGMTMFVAAYTDGDDLIVGERRIPLLRQQRLDSECKSLADFINADGDYVGLFLTGAGHYIESEYKRMNAEGDYYNSLLLQTLSDRLAEASSEYMHFLTRRDYWGYAPNEEFEPERLFNDNYDGIRPAMGYPMLPDQLLNKEIVDMLQPESGKRVAVTENGAMTPSSTISGLYIANPKARYLTLGIIGEDQIENYAKRRGISADRIREILNK